MRLLLLLVLVGIGGCLQVDSPDGTLFCSPVPKRACPEGFYCLPGDNTCWRIGHYPNDMARPQHFQPGGPEDMSVALPDDLSTTDDLSTADDLSQSD
jgi:hypothetical protein